FPIAELQALRERELHYQGRADDAPPIAAQRLELELELELESLGDIELNFADTLILTWQQNELRLARRSLVSGQWTYRYWTGAARRLQILCDHSSVEIFINDGEGVMSSRYFPDHPAILTLRGRAELQARYWSLRRCMVE
uniref:GH32 C-terminal domain-containing protein n=1 Tax=Enterobacter agglomerans TaxID=549 RepID=UPI001654728B